jgi:hypothetical protein
VPTMEEWAVVDSAHALPAVITPPPPGAHELVPAEGCYQARIRDWKAAGDNRVESFYWLPGNACVDLCAPLQRFYSLMWPATATEPREEEQGPERRSYFSFAYSDFAAMNTGMSESASFQSVRKS